ncbi:MAG: cysteine hydrolase [Gammaproteobacteria bacterium]|nr:cysteine hydrolase [Gammaproteobacteria bacterium]
MPPQKPDTRPSGAVHDCSLPQWAIDKMTRRRGRRHAFEIIASRRTALVVVDLVQTYVEGTPCAASIVTPVARLAACLRAAGGAVAWVYPASMPADDPTLQALWGREHLQKNVAETVEGSNGKVLAEGLDPDPADIVVEKKSYSAFFPGLCPLPEMLAERDIDTVMIAGVLTNICCESSARDAAALGYKVIMVADANAARSDEEHQAALYNILRNFGDVRMTDDLIAVIGG